MIRLSAEQTLLLLGSRPHLTAEDKTRFAALLAGTIDWPFLLWRAETCQTLPMLRAHIAALGLEAKVPDFVALYMANWSALSAARSITQFGELGAILRVLEDERIDYYLLKGAAIAAMVYPDPLTRPMQDLDIMIHPHDAARVQQLMYAIGYKHGVFVPDTGRFHHLFRKITRASLERSHALHSMTKVIRVPPPVPEALVLPEWRRRQIKCAFNSDGSLSMPVFIDFHITLSPGMDEADVWRGAEYCELLGQRVSVQSPTAMLWFSATRVYREAFEYNTLKLQMFGDIDALLRVRGDEIDWASLLTVAEKYGFAAPLFYVLSQARDLQGAQVPEPVLAMLAPDPRRMPSPLDQGDVVPKLLSQPVVTRFAMA